MSETKTLRINNDNLRKVHNLYLKYGLRLFVQTTNDFLIMEGICPDIPVGFEAGMIQIQGIWQPGAEYRQYEQWERYIEDIWPNISTSGFGRIKVWKD